MSAQSIGESIEIVCDTHMCSNIPEINFKMSQIIAMSKLFREFIREIFIKFLSFVYDVENRHIFGGVLKYRKNKSVHLNMKAKPNVLD